MHFFYDWHHFRELPGMFYLAAVVLLLLCRPLLRRLPPQRHAVLLQRVALCAGLLTLAVYLALCLCTLRSFMMDTDEANILGIAAASLHGQPMYHAIHSPDVSYTFQYGPMLFLVYRSAMILGQAAFWPLRLFVVAANFCACFALFSALRKLVRWQTALALMAFPLCFMLHYISYSMGLRSDIWIVLAVSLALRCSMLESPALAILLTSIFAGVAVDFKMPAILPFALLMLMLYRRLGAKAAALAVVIGVGTALSPFSLHTASLPNYLAWVTQSSRTGPQFDVMLFCFLYAASLLLPLLTLGALGFQPWPRPAGATTRGPLLLEPLLFFACLLVAASVSSKVGAGTYHLWPLLPILTVYIAQSIAAGRQEAANPLRLDYVVCLIALTSAAFGLSFLQRDIHDLQIPTSAQSSQLRLARQELQQDLDLYHGRTLQIGYGPSPNELVERLRYVLIFHGQPYTLDGPGRLEAWILPFPPNISNRMANCTDDVWLIPHGEIPFYGYFYFPATLHRTFVQHYDQQRQGAIYDAWVCRSDNNHSEQPSR